ncbi:MAG: prepilin-type N-terminal cleavage/methylation domain-containing protein [Anaerorhabdus sp.]|uniref:prepilin-type N-terminal cleavage/methylation domain-containing protein n=2 Tax=Anaerorhabdus sp. TaxID=1872524 RepID=UPI002FC6EDE5
MVKQSYNRGFTLVDLLIVIAIISVCMTLVLPFYKLPNFTIYDFSNEYIMKQSECIREGKSEIFEFDGEAFYTYAIQFNERGNIRQAQTIRFEDGKEIVSNLAGGRIEFK